MPPVNRPSSPGTRYREALEGEDPIPSMRGAMRRIERAIHGLTARQLATVEALGKWSIRDVIGHLADGEIILGARLRLIAAHDHPPIPGYDENLFVARLGLGNASAKTLLDSFTHARATTLDLLARLPESAWKRTGIHSERGEESIDELVVMYAGHDRIHEKQIARVRAVVAPPRARARRKR